jgi:transcriptional regulator with XRE-family HTH domain
MTSAIHPVTGDDLRRRELSAFLRNRRERISPGDVGLPPGGRRRTPGLRREEVAQLAGVGITWYTWLEQGRDIKASDQVLGAIAMTLRLDPHERAHLFTLAGSPRPVAPSECSVLTPEMHVILRHLEPLPAAVLSARMDILGYNRTYEWVFGLDDIPFEDRNAMVLLFTHPRWRTRMADWPESVPRAVAQFRASMAGHVADKQWKFLVRKLRAESPEFEALWGRHEVRWMDDLTKRFNHPEGGPLDFRYTNLWFGPRSETRLCTFTPSNEDTWAAVRACQAALS